MIPNASIKSTLDLASEVPEAAPSQYPVKVASNHSDIHIRSETIETGFIPLTRISKKIEPHTDNGKWKGLLERDLPRALHRKLIRKTGND